MTRSADKSVQQLVDEFVDSAHGNLAKVQEFVRAHPDLVDAKSSAAGERALNAAAHMGRKDIAEFLLTAGAEPDMCTACMLGKLNRVADFVRRDPGAVHATRPHGFPALTLAVIGGNKDVVELLLSRGADLDAGQGCSTPLHAAAQSGQRELAAWASATNR